ncbi:hypothetical protein ON010_g14843 [Phytophthora cinnamomi]|nr:hypothetical protein ON010_g14843 [Phytophthora cinnamomi]
MDGKENGVAARRHRVKDVRPRVHETEDAPQRGRGPSGPGNQQQQQQQHTAIFPSPVTSQPQRLAPKAFTPTMHNGARVEETSDSNPSSTRSFSSAKFSKISAVLALQRPGGHIQLEFPAEDAIDLQTPRVDATGNTNQSSDPPTHGQDNDSKKQPTTRLDTDLVSVPPLMSICILVS